MTEKHNTVLNPRIPATVEAVIHDPERMWPMPAIGSRIRISGRNASLTVPLASGVIDVQASRQLLDLVFKLCDGTRTLAQAVTGISDLHLKTQFTDFVRFLIIEGALMDASLITAKANLFAFQRNPFGRGSPAKLTDTIASRFLWNVEEAALPIGAAEVDSVPLDTFFSSRVTSKTFDNKPISSSTLHKLLWSLAGVVSTEHPNGGYFVPQRTIASAGGMHLVEIYVALRRAVDQYSPGVYSVQYPQERMVVLKKISPSLNDLACAFIRPQHLTFATGALFLAADPEVAALRYRNRALQFLFMEAGAALHNGGLSAHTLNLGYATIGGYDEAPVARLCGLSRQLVLGSALFGAQPSALQREQATKSRQVEFSWAVNAGVDSTLPFYAAGAKASSNANSATRINGYSSSGSNTAAEMAFLGEISQDAYQHPRDTQAGRFDEVPDAVDPERCLSYSKSQYGNPGFSYTPFSRTEFHQWVKGQDLVTQQPVRVLAELVFSGESVQALLTKGSKPYTHLPDLGCVADTTPDRATLRSLLSLVEQDAFMRHWSTQQPGDFYSIDTAPELLSRRFENLADRGCTVSIQRLSVPSVHCVLVSVQNGAAHFTTIALGTSDSFERAVEYAMDALELRVAASLAGYIRTIRGPKQVQSAAHHFELYGLKPYYRRADSLLFPLQQVIQASWPDKLPPVTLGSVIEELKEQGLQPLAVDISPEKSHIHQGRTPVSVVKALVPGLIPILFGYKQEARGMIERINPEANFPHPFSDFQPTP